MPDDLKEAIRHALDASGGTARTHPNWAGMAANVGLALYRQYVASGRPEDLGNAVAAAQAALRATPAHSPDAAGCALNLAIMLRSQAAMSRDEPQLTRSVEAARLAIALLPAHHPDRGICLSALGRALRLRSQVLGSAADAEASIVARLEAAAVSTAPPEERGLAARTAAEWAIADGDAKGAFHGYAMAVELLSRVAWHGLDPTDRQHRLAQWRDLSQDAAASALTASCPSTAVELLEGGRSVLWNQQLQYRTDLGLLDTVDPEIASRLRDIGIALDHAAGNGADSRPGRTKDLSHESCC